MKTIVFISSTGGHLSELLQLDRIIKENNSYIITENMSSNKVLRKKYDNVHYLLSGTIASGKFIYFFKYLINCIISLFYFFRIHPNIVISTGAHNTIPFCLISKLFGAKLIYIETYANIRTKSRTGRLLYNFADLFLVQWKCMLNLYPKAEYVGSVF